MNTPKNLDTLKRKVYLAYHQDGILDLLAAAILLGFSTFTIPADKKSHHRSTLRIRPL